MWRERSVTRFTQAISGHEGITRVCTVILDLTYALNLNHPMQQNQNVQSFQKHLMELEALQLSNKSKLLP